MSSSSSSSHSSAFPLDLLSPPPSEQLCYVHCNSCDTILAVSVPYSSLFMVVTVKCGHCTNHFSVNMRALLLPTTANQLNVTQPLLASMAAQSNFLQNAGLMAPPLPLPPPASFQIVEPPIGSLASSAPAAAFAQPTPKSQLLDYQENLHPTTAINRPPEKRQRVPSAYNRFIKDEIQRIKAVNPDITHREAFSAAAKNWAHFPHIHFGVTPDQVLRKSSSGARMPVDGEGLYAAAANMGITPF